MLIEFRLRECSYDVDPLIECDDEFWTNADPAQAFKQPPGKPSKIVFTNHLLGLLKIFDFLSRTIVSELVLYAVVRNGS